jgi:hypothetical protein
MAVGCAVVATNDLAAQADVTLEVGASQVGPAVGLQADDARFAMGGVRASLFGTGGSGVYASVLGGTVLRDSTGGSFVSGIVEATVRDAWSTRWSGSMDVRLLGFGIRDPFPYRTFAAEIGPSVRYQPSGASIEVGVLAGIGHSRWTLWRRLGGLTRTFEDDLWRIGTTAEVMVGSPTVQVGLAGSAHESSGMTYASVGGRMVFAGGWGALELRADRWDTPAGFETTGGLSFAIPLGAAWSFRGFFGRSDPDPLTLAQPGSGSGGALLGWSVYSTAPTPIARDALFEVLSYGADSNRIRMILDDVPAGARRVQVLGDFTLWDAVPMERDGALWVAEVDVRPGTHHFGFLVDDEWYLPDDAPDAAPDEWGRLTATLVIEGAGS